MRIGLISDIHGDFHSLRRVWGHLQALGVEKVLCAGDMVGRGPDPDLTVDFLVEQSIVAIRGNHDRWAIERGPGTVDPMGFVAPTQATLEKLKNLSALRLLPVGGQLLTMVHGTPGSDLEYMNRVRYGPDRLAKMLADLETDILVVGHTHMPMWFRTERGLVVNPGSLLCFGSERSSRTFAILDTKEQTAAFFHAVTGREVKVPVWDSLE